MFFLACVTSILMTLDSTLNESYMPVMFIAFISTIGFLTPRISGCHINLQVSTHGPTWHLMAPCYFRAGYDNMTWQYTVTSVTTMHPDTQAEYHPGSARSMKRLLIWASNDFAGVPRRCHGGILLLLSYRTTSLQDLRTVPMCSSKCRIGHDEATGQVKWHRLSHSGSQAGLPANPWN